MSTAPGDAAETSLDVDVARALARLDHNRTERDYWRQEELIVVPGLLEGDVVERVSAQVRASRSRLVRRSIPGYKASASMSRLALAEVAPAALALYRCEALLRFLRSLSDMPLQACPDEDPHACAVYHYDRPGDRIGWHYDTSWYRGARYTVLIGLLDESSARLHCRLHSRDRHRPSRDLLVATTPGTLVFFNGDKLLHAVTALGSNEHRVVLSLQYVSDPHMSTWRRVVSTAKDSLAYFGVEGLRRPRRRLIGIARPTGLRADVD